MNAPLLELPPLSLYIHIPWCIKKCPYCDFNSHQQNGPLPESEYVNSLIKDLQNDACYAQGRKLHSIFIGGGTPSLFSARSIETLLKQIEIIIPFEDDIEITLEANPGTFEQQKFSDFRQAGINRLSIGIQSFQQQYLQSLGRVHNDQEAKNAAEIALKAGFTNFNLDLMFGLPNQSLQHALLDLEIALSFEPTHLSWYQLTIETNTQFYSFPPILPIEDTIIDIQEQGNLFLAEHNLFQYEISAFSNKNKQAKHNLNYWLFGDYIGIGAGAHGKITILPEQKIIRTKKTRQPSHYLDINKPFLSASTQVNSTELPLEFMMNALRLYQSCDISTFEARTGLSIDVIKEQLHNSRKLQLLESECIKPTAKGHLFLNNLLSCFT